MPSRKPRSIPAPATPAFVPPYPPSWVDRLTDALGRLPGPAWLAFVALGAVGVALQLAIQLSTGDFDPGRYLPFLIWTTGNFAYLLGLIYYLDRSAPAALDAFRPALHLSPARGPTTDDHAAFADLRYRLTTLPARTTAWVTILGGFILAAIPMLLIRGPAGGSFDLMRSMTSFGLSSSPAAFAAALAQLLVTQAILAALVYHTIHQLRLIQHIYLHHTRLNLYRLEPLYAFSTPAALTAAGLLLYSYLWFASTPELLNEPASLGLAAFFSGIAILTFTWPLWGIHRRLVAEKARLLQQSSARFEAVVAQLHQRVDRQRLARMDDLNKTLASLEIEQAALRRIPTWPWEPGTVRGLAAALLVPLVLWLTQTILERLMG